MSFQALSSELTGWLPGLSPFLADSMINRAWREVRDARLWSFLQEDCGIFCPAQITSGAVAIVQFSATVTCNAAASAALLAVSLPSPLTLTALQIRFGATAGSGSVQSGQVYSIASYDASTPTAVVLTLDRVVMDPTDATATYQAYRCYIKPVVDDFLAWQSIVDMTNGWSLRLDRTSTEFDRRDPQRQAQWMAYYCGAFKGNPELQPKPQYELWPHPTSGQTFYGRYRRQGEDFENAADTQPQLIPDSLIIHRALGYHAYPWAAANVGHFPALKTANFAVLMLDAKKMYQEDLVRAKKQDNEQELSDVWSRGHGLIHGGRFGRFKGITDWPIDAAFLQGHLINF